MAQNGRILAPQAVCLKTVKKQCFRCRRYSNVVRLSSLKGESSNTGRKNIFTNKFFSPLDLKIILEYADIKGRFMFNKKK